VKARENLRRWTAAGKSTWFRGEGEEGGETRRMKRGGRRGVGRLSHLARRRPPPPRPTATPPGGWWAGAWRHQVGGRAEAQCSLSIDAML
jgi:hypothetical protein